MPITQHFDRLLFGATIVLTAVGLAVMGSASWVLATERYGRSASYFVTWQSATAAVGLLLMLVVMHLKTEVVLRPKVTGTFLALSWLLLLGAYLQPPINATHRWLSLGSISVQPSVVARLALILLTAVLLAKARENEWDWKSLGLLVATSSVTAVLVLAEPDLGSAVLIVATIGAMTFVAGMPLRLLTVPCFSVMLAAVFAVLTSPYRLARVKAFIGAGASAAGYQSRQSMIAIGSGGLLGRGYGTGIQKLFFLPEPHTDFVFASTAEELGLAGIIVLVALAGVITWRGLQISWRQPASARAL
ncbi:MAG: FtsW/RodA/SpoVE family cell cycle protein, partial [Acidobacteria bacterium]|nr:FtsW/RodA/SpoVE family cell cycle protein [Acidobacteriota bacterium]